MKFLHLFQNMLRILTRYFLANHGLVTYAKTLEEAYMLNEKVEQFAEISFYAKMLGGEKELNKSQIAKLNKLKSY